MPRKNNMRNRRKPKKPRPNRLPLMKGVSTRPDYTVEFMNPQGYFIRNNSVAEAKGIILFDLNNCIGKGNYTAIFDYYRINWVDVRFVPVMSTVVNRPFDDSTTPGINQAVPQIITALDRDSTNTPASFVELQDRGVVKLNKCTKAFNWKFTPNRLVQIYKTISTTGYKIDTGYKEFLDCANPDIPHFGLKYVIEQSSPSDAFIYEIQIKYNVSFKGKRG